MGRRLTIHPNRRHFMARLNSSVRPVEADQRDFEWNELEGVATVRQGLAVLMASEPTGKLQPIGTAFIVKCFDKTAIAITATHNLEAIRSLQATRARHHPSTPPEFISGCSAIDITHPKIHAIAFNGDRLRSCKILWAVAVERTDTSIVCLDSSDEPNFFVGEFLLSARNPAPGDSIAVLGFSGMCETPASQNSTNPSHFGFQLRVLVRTGKVTQAHPNGHLLCKASCLESSIPVFPGMSGGPAFFFSEQYRSIEVFGIICSDSVFLDESLKYDRSKPGQSTIALIDRTVEVDEGGVRSVSFRMENALVHLTPQA